MPRRSPSIPYVVCLTPRDDDVDLEVVRDDLRRMGSYRFVGIEPDGTIEVGASASSMAKAEARVERDLEDDYRGVFIIGHHPL